MIFSLGHRTLLISFLIHLIVLSSFVFTFSGPQESYKPQMVFLGPILKRQDVVNDTAKDPQRVRPMGSKGTEVTFWPGKKTDVFTPSPLNKPASSEPSSSVPKMTLKSTFPVSINKKDKKPSRHEGIDTLIRPYEPLRLYPHD